MYSTWCPETSTTHYESLFFKETHLIEGCFGSAAETDLPRGGFIILSYCILRSIFFSEFLTFYTHYKISKFWFRNDQPTTIIKTGISIKKQYYSINYW